MSHSCFLYLGMKVEKQFNSNHLFHLLKCIVVH